jgi:hypothetical protein
MPLDWGELKVSGRTEGVRYFFTVSSVAREQLSVVGSQLEICANR